VPASLGARLPRRALLRGALDAVRAALPGADGYEIVARWDLLAGGVGLFVATAAVSPDALRALAEHLRARFAAAPDLVVQIFDDAAAARIVRAGSRSVGETPFAAARARQRATYQRSAARRLDRLTIHAQPPRIVDF